MSLDEQIPVGDVDVWVLMKAYRRNKPGLLLHVNRRTPKTLYVDRYYEIRDKTDHAYTTERAHHIDEIYAIDVTPEVYLAVVKKKWEHDNQLVTLNHNEESEIHPIRLRYAKSRNALLEQQAAEIQAILKKGDDEGR